MCKTKPVKYAGERIEDVNGKKDGSLNLEEVVTVDEREKNNFIERH